MSPTTTNVALAPADQTGYNAYSHLIRNYLAVTGA